MLAAGASLFVATSCDTQNKEKGYSVSNREEINWQGIAAHEVERARHEFHVDGSGVKVCVLSDSVRYLEETKGITPQDVAVLQDQNGNRQDGKQRGGEDKGEGTAMLEIVHSIAPGAELMFATSGSKPQQMFNNIIALGKERCDIIVDDHEFYEQSPFQDDKISRAVNEVTANGILYITSAGNRGNTKNGTSAAWEGFFKAGRVLKDSRGKPIRTMHEFSDKQDGEYNDVLGECGRDGGEVHVLLFWNDPILPQGDNRQSADRGDYELWALDSNGVLKDGNDHYVTTARLKDEKGNYISTACLKDKDEKGKCIDDTTAVEKPCRHICFPAPNRNDPNLTSIVITKVAGTGDRFLHVDFFVRGSKNKNDCKLEHQTPGVISGHHGAASAFSVASKSAGQPDPLHADGVFLGGQSEHVNGSSAEGPRRMFFTPDGHPYSCPRDLQKPDVTAADGVTTDVESFKPFFRGTSAAAPQVAGIAALMKSKDRSLTAEEIKAALRKSAIQIEGAAEWNPLSGFGIVNAVRALRAIKTVKSTEGREAASYVCQDECQRSRRVAQPLQSSMASRRLAPLK